MANWCRWWAISHADLQSSHPDYPSGRADRESDQHLQNMLQNTATLPQNIWGQATKDLTKLQSIVEQGQGIAFSMGNIDDALKAGFQSYTDFNRICLTAADFSNTYRTWSEHQPRHDRRDLEGRRLHQPISFRANKQRCHNCRRSLNRPTGQMQALAGRPRNRRPTG